MSRQHEDWLQRVRLHLDGEARDLDASTASRLNRARQRALDAGLGARRGGRGFWYALAGASLALLLSLSLSLTTTAPAPPVHPTTAGAESEDFDLLAGTEDLELIENLEFYAWLEQQSLDG